MKNFLAILFALVLTCAPAVAQVDDANSSGLSTPVKRLSRPVASMPSQNVQRGMPPAGAYPPPVAAKPKPARPADTKAWQPTVVATGADNPVITSHALAPVFTGQIRTEPKPRPDPVKAAPAPRLVTGSSGSPGGAAAPATAEEGSVGAIGGDGQLYCSNIIDAAADQRFAWQKQVISDLGRDLEQRIKKLEEKTAEYKEWLTKRDEFVNRATGNLVKIYARMKPDAAAAQLTQLDEETAAAVLSKLEPKATSTILNEMDPKKAALLTGIIAGAARLDPEGKKS